MQNELAPLTVTQLNRQVRSWLEIEVGEIRVIGELSNLSKPSSGHFYFTLKDSSAQLRCVYFRTHHDENTRHFKDGQQVIASGKLSVYEARGDYQLIIHSLKETGLGELFRKFEQLKASLNAQGLFEASRKKIIPRFPTTIGVITSTSGAALHDILTALARRFPIAHIKVYPSEVQGKGASQQLVKAIQQANQDKQIDVLILARGGGSLEDLWAFNDEQLAIAISNSLIPIVSGIGHETDFTIADFVADLRAATPTAAAEAVAPHQAELIHLIESWTKRLIKALLRTIEHKQFVLSHQISKILSPETLVTKHWQTLDYLERQLPQTINQLLRQKRARLDLLMSKLDSKNPTTLLNTSRVKFYYIQQRLTQSMLAKLLLVKQQVQTQLTTLHAISPLATLDRGYAIATHNQHILFDSSLIREGDRIEIQLSKGIVLCKVTGKIA